MTVSSDFRLKAVDIVQDKSEGLVYYENNSREWNVVIQVKNNKVWEDVSLVFVDPDYQGDGEKAHKLK